MKKTIILETLAAAVFATAQAHAAPISLDQAVITATYQGAGDGILGLDSGFQPGPGSNVSGLDPSDTGIEFLTADYVFGFDFSRTGMLTVYDNLPVPALADGAAGYTFTFDFGSTLPSTIASFTLLDASMVNGVPGLSVLSSHSIGLDLSNITWNGDFSTFTAQIGAADGPGANVPEPGSLALLLAGAAGLGASRKRSRKQS